MARMQNVARFKRTVTLPSGTASNVRRVQIDPRVKYSRRIREEANVINKMLSALKSAGYSDTWASKTLFNKLETPQIDIISNGRIDVSKINKSYSMSNLAYIKKSLNDFKASKTSTVKGVKARIEDERQFIAEQTDNEEFARSLTDDELSKIYSVFNDVDYKALTESGQYESNEIFSFIVEAKEQDSGIRKFLSTVRTYSEEGLDYDTRLAFTNIYNKYVKSSS